MAAILGVSPWEGPADVWARKKGLTPEKPDNLRFQIGRKFEGPIAELYAEQEGVQLLKVDGLYRHPGAPIVGTPDRLIADQMKGLEIKTADPAVAHTWGEPGTDEIPLYYTTQVACYMALLGYNEWDVAVLFGTSDFRIYRLHRDMELENMILERAREFWQTYIVGDKEPPPDSSRSYGEYLVKKYPSNVMPMLAASEQDDNDIGCLLALRVRKKEIEEEETLFENIVKGRIGENDGIQSHLGKITWKKTKDSEKVNWEGIARELHPAIPVPLIEKHTEVKPGVRRFLVAPSKLPVKGGKL
jgi:putative phage-type endonuclease